MLLNPKRHLPVVCALRRSAARKVQCSFCAEIYIRVFCDCPPGVLYGRYDGDHYAGGNPWVLTSGCLAQLYYRAAAAVAKADHYVHGDQELLQAWARATAPSQHANSTTGPPIQSAAELASALAAAGDGVLVRIRYHTVGGGLHQPEQLDKNTGFEASAKDLTWSYATLLKAMKQRAATLDAMAEMRV